jgi:hypothetical protein
MNKFRTIMAALLLATAATACGDRVAETNNVVVVEDEADANVPSTTEEMENTDENSQ